jgi:hypothetical protein
MSDEGKRWLEYSPAWAPHVKGRFQERDVDEDGLPDEAPVEARCETCGATFKRRCSSGLMRQHIAKFALVHLHRGPLDPLPIKT